MLSYLRFPDAKYSNGPDGYGHVDAVAKVKFPCSKHLKYSGKVEIKGRGSTSSIAEEHAAFQALLCIEENFGVKIIDLNHCDRVEAVKVQTLLVRMLDEILEVCEVVKKNWEKMVKSFEGQSEDLRYEGSLSYKPTLTEDDIAACLYCANGTARVDQDSSKTYEECSGLFNSLHEITCELNVVKLKLDII